MRRLRGILEEDDGPRHAPDARRRRAQACDRLAVSSLASGPSMRVRPLTLLLVVLAAVAVGACGDKQERTLHGETEGTYIDVGNLKYQVQISRLLNPHRPRGPRLPRRPARRPAARPSEQWFAVFMRVENDSDKAGPRGDAITRSATRRATSTGPSRWAPRTSSPIAPAALPAQGPAAAARHPGGGEHDPGLDAAVQDPGRQLPEPPARAPDPVALGSARTSARSTSTSRPV